MSRAVTADHILFNECIDAFRREQKNHLSLTDNEPSNSFVLTSFELNQDWDLGICVIHPSIRVILPGAYSAFISKVDNPDWVGKHNSHLFGIALSAIISFITHKPCKSTRDDYLCNRGELSDFDVQQLAIIHPVLTVGPGANQTSLSKERQTLLGQELKNLLELLHKVDYKKYVTVMQSIRLAHLSLINKRDDFGLAYLLVVSAIEAIAQNAIKRDKVKQDHPSEKEWKERAKNDDVFAQLYKTYKESRGQNQYLKERYTKFILEFAPVNKWEEYVLHPMQELSEYIKDISPSHSVDHFTEKNWFEKYPTELKLETINEILGDSYTHRSCFIHRGEQPPHKDPQSSMYRFFQEYREFTNYVVEENILPNYQLLIGIFKHSLLNWLSK